MNVQGYETEQLSNKDFKFFSVGPKGTYDMRISIRPINRSMYNLGFGVWSEEKQDIDDEIEIRNGDMDKILATVGKIALELLQKYPGLTLVATGSVPKGEMAVRTRKYQMGINKNFDFLSEHHKIGGYIADRVNGKTVGNFPNWSGSWHDFQKGTNYDAFLLTRK